MLLLLGEDWEEVDSTAWVVVALPEGVLCLSLLMENACSCVQCNKHELCLGSPLLGSPDREKNMTGSNTSEP